MKSRGYALAVLVEVPFQRGRSAGRQGWNSVNFWRRMGIVKSVVQKFAHLTGVVLGVPEIVVIEPTNRCNLNCTMCYRREHLKETGDMSLGLFKKIAQSVKGARHICCHGGGEPLLHPQIFEMINYTYEICHPETLSITTNGTLLNQEMARKLQASKLNRLYVSIDGADKQTYEAIREVPFEEVVENIRYFKSISEIYTVIQYTVMKQNLKSLLNLPQLVSYMGAEAINVQHLLNWNLQIGNQRIIELYNQFQEIRERVIEQAKQYGIECYIPPIPSGLDKCDLPFRQIYFNFKGAIAPCCVAIHISLEKDFNRRNGKNIRHWRRRVIRGDFFPECQQFCYVKSTQ